MKLNVYNTAGKQITEIDAADEVFAIEPNRFVLHQAYVAQMANRRSGNAHTLRRGEVEGSTVKIRKQKGLGRSRQGGIRASHHVGGGVAHGPRPHSFNKDLPRTMRRLALRSALSTHAAAGTLLVVQDLMPADAKTKTLKTSLTALGVNRRGLVVTGDYVQEITRASSNIENVKAVPAQNLNVVDILNAQHLVMSEEAIRRCEALWGGLNIKPARGRVREAV